MAEILMPKATAVWLIDNTGLSFEQIAEFCGLHHLEVKGIADGDIAATVRGADPIANGQLTREEIDAAEQDAERRLTLKASPNADLVQRRKRGPRYTPVSRRQERPNAIAWMVKNHPEVSDGQISKLIGTTKTTIEAVRSRTHWNANNIQPQDPVALGLCSQLDLDEAVRKAAAKRAASQPAEEAAGAALTPLGEGASGDLAGTDGGAGLGAGLGDELEDDPLRPQEAPDVDKVFANMGGSARSSDESDDPAAP